MSRLLSLVELQKQKIEARKEQERQIMLSQALRKSGNQAVENYAILHGFYSYTHAFSDGELYFALDYNLYRKSKESGKKNKKFYDDIIGLLHAEMRVRGLSYTTREEIRTGHAHMTDKEREQFINQTL
jgi:hypothetical protein